MLTSARMRLMRDFKRLHQDPPYGIAACPHDMDIMFWNAVVFGPDDTAWDGGYARLGSDAKTTALLGYGLVGPAYYAQSTFKLTLQFSEDYPDKPPIVRFVSKMFHPNVYADDSICLDIFRNEWTPVYDVASILTSSVQSLLCDPTPTSLRTWNSSSSLPGRSLFPDRGPLLSATARLFSENKRKYRRKYQSILI